MVIRSVVSLRFIAVVAVGLAWWAGTPGRAPATSAAPIKVLLIDGQNNHQWATTTPLLKRILEETGRFTVDVSTSPAQRPPAPRLPKDATAEQKAAHEEKLKTHAAADAAYLAKRDALWAAWRPAFAKYDVVLSNYNGESWPAEVRTAFEAYVRGGGGFVSYHAANNSFPEWPEYNRMIGLGGWGGRNEKSGPYLRFRNGQWVKDNSPGPGGGHGAQHEFMMDVHQPAHLIMAGLPKHWMHAKDELYHGLRGPAEQLTVLASSKSDKTNDDEPLLMTLTYGQGRVFHTALGHYVDALYGLGFQVTLQRGTEWAATGKVTIPAPKPELLSGPAAATREVKAP